MHLLRGQEDAERETAAEKRTRNDFDSHQTTPLGAGADTRLLSVMTADQHPLPSKLPAHSSNRQGLSHNQGKGQTLGQGQHPKAVSTSRSRRPQFSLNCVLRAHESTVLAVLTAQAGNTTAQPTILEFTMPNKWIKQAISARLLLSLLLSLKATLILWI